MAADHDQYEVSGQELMISEGTYEPISNTAAPSLTRSYGRTVFLKDVHIPVHDAQGSTIKCVEMVRVCAIADHRHRYKLTGVTRYVCVSGPVRCMSLSHHVTYDITHVMMISHPSDDQVAWSHCIAVTVMYVTLYIYLCPCI